MTSFRIQSRLFCIIRRTSCLHSPRLFSSTAPTSARKRTRVAKETEYNVDDLPEFKFDDITTPAHEMLAAQKEVRKYLRKMLFEIPQLTGERGKRASTMNGWDKFELGNHNFQ